MEQDKLLELKAKYGKIYKMTINNIDWYYRAMTRTEFKNYSKEQMENAENITQLDLEDMIFDVCNLNNKKSNEVDAGVVTVLSDAIMKATGFVEDVVPEEL